MRFRRILASLTLLATLTAFPGCTPNTSSSRNDVAYVEDENARLKQLLIQYENDARNNQVMVADANGRVQRVNLELEAASRKIGVYEQEIPRLRTLAVQAAQTAQVANQAQYAQYQQYVQYMNQMNKNRPAQGGQGVLRQDLSQQLSALAEQFGGVVVGNRIELPGDFFFDSGRYDLNPNARAAIRRMAEILAGENLQLMVVGHTDNDPIKNPALRSKGITDNLHLSLLRAKAVVDELKKAGYPSELMYPTGWGELKPIVPNTDRASKKLNRRVDILIDPTAAQTMAMSQITGVEPVGASSQAGYSSSEPMATTYVQGYSQTGSAYDSAPSYSTIENIEPATNVTADVYSTTTYAEPSYSSAVTTSTYVDQDAGTASLVDPSYSTVTTSTYSTGYAAPSYADPYAAPAFQQQPDFGLPVQQPYGAPAYDAQQPMPQQMPMQQQPMPYAPQQFVPQQQYNPEQPFGDPFAYQQQQMPMGYVGQPLAMQWQR